MSTQLKVTRDTSVIVTMGEEYAGKLNRSIIRALAAFDHLEPAARTQLVNTGTVDDLLALRLAIERVLP